MKPAAARSQKKPIYVGITGHRPNRLPVGQLDRVKRALVRAMTGIEARYRGRRFILLSGLAEGADRLAAFTALGRRWGLWTILPFHRTRFEQDFPEPFAKGEFRALLDVSTVVEEPKRGRHARSPDEGYDAVGRRLLALSDVLIAVWDGEPSRGKGGTVDVIEQARTEGIPVIWIHAKRAIPLRELQPTAGRRGNMGLNSRRSSASAT